MCILCHLEVVSIFWSCLGDFLKSSTGIYFQRRSRILSSKDQAKKNYVGTQWFQDKPKHGAEQNMKNNGNRPKVHGQTHLIARTSADIVPCLYVECFLLALKPAEKCVLILWSTDIFLKNLFSPRTNADNWLWEIEWNWNDKFLHIFLHAWTGYFAYIMYLSTKFRPFQSQGFKTVCFRKQSEPKNTNFKLSRLYLTYVKKEHYLLSSIYITHNRPFS